RPGTPADRPAPQAAQDLPGAGGRRPATGAAGCTAARCRVARRPHPAGSRLRGGAARPVAARPAGALSQDRPGRLVAGGHHRRPQPAGAPDDRRGGAADLAAGAGGHRRSGPGRPRAGRLARDRSAQRGRWHLLNAFSEDINGHWPAATNLRFFRRSPVQFDASGERARHGNSMPHSETTLGRILVVDDQAANLRVVSALLTREGYQVITASSGQEALARYAETVPDMILLDMMMPGMDGFEVLAALRAQEPPLRIPVVFVTAAHDRDLLLRAFDAGVVDYVTKPFLPEELLARVNAHIGLKLTRDRLERVAREREELVNLVA